MRVDPVAFKLVHSGVERTQLNICQHHPHVCSTKCTRQSKSDAAGRAGYERALSLEFAHVSLHDLVPPPAGPYSRKKFELPRVRRRKLLKQCRPTLQMGLRLFIV